MTDKGSSLGILFFQNVSDCSLSFEIVTIEKQEVWGAEGILPPRDSSIVWCRVWPPVVSPGQRGELKCYASDNVLFSASAEIAYQRKGAEEKTFWKLFERPATLQWKGITFCESPKVIWFGLTSSKKEERVLSSIELDGSEKLEKCLASTDLLLGPGKTLIVGIPISKEMKQGQDVFLTCRADDGEIIAARVRADFCFPISDLREGTNNDLNTNEDHFWSVWGSQRETSVKTETHLCLLGCPAHAHGSETEATLKLGRIYGEQRASSQGNAIGYVFVCKAQQDDFVAMCTPLADGVLTNPLESFSPVNRPHPNRTNVLVDSLLPLSAPAPWYALIAMHPDGRFSHLRGRAPSSEEIEYIVWRSIGGGAKGLVYREEKGRQYLPPSVIGNVNHEVAKCLPQLRYAIQVASQDVSDGRARADILQAGFEELFIIFSNNTIAYSPEPLTPTSVEWLTNLEVDLPIPSGYEPLGEPSGNSSARLLRTEAGFKVSVDSMKYSGIVRVKLQRQGS